MKRSPQDQKFIHNLEPSKFSKEGFFGTDTRSLEEIIADDLRVLMDSGVTKQSLVKEMKEVYQRRNRPLVRKWR